MDDLLTGGNQGKYIEWVLVTAVVYILLGLLFGPITVSFAAALYYRRPSRRNLGILVLGSAISFILLVALSDGTRVNRIFDFWLYSVPLFPVVTVLFHGVVMFSRFLKPKSLKEQLAEQERKEAARRARMSANASRTPEAKSKSAIIRLGAKIKGDRFPDHLGVSVKDNWLTISENVLDQHLFILGTTGAGKSEAIKRLVNEFLISTNRNIYLVDGKGDEDLADDIRSLAYHHGRGRAPVFKLGFASYGAIYDGFRGESTDVYNRLCALIGTSEAEGGAQFYADINRDLLQLICYAPGGPPRNFEELRARMNKSWLADAYRDDEVELETIEDIEKRYMQGLTHRIRPLAREFSLCIGDDGFALEHTPAAIFSLRVQSVGDTAQRFLDFLVEDLKDFIGKRQTQPSVLIIDEFGQFSNKNITALLSLARSSQLAIVLATQDVASLNDEQTKKLVLANTRTKLLMASEFPEDVAQLAGTTYQIESSIQHQEGDPTGMGSARVQHAFKVDMNEAAKLRPGEAFLIRQRHVAKIKVKRIGEIKRIEKQKEEKRQKRDKGTVSARSHKRPRSLD